jgi:hypothetical protein
MLENLLIFIVVYDFNFFFEFLIVTVNSFIFKPKKVLFSLSYWLLLSVAFSHFILGHGVKICSTMGAFRELNSGPLAP